MKRPLFSLILGLAALLSALDFTMQPALSKDGSNKLWVEFAVSDYTDVTVSIVDTRDSTILRHLAGGVLGSNAPLPLTPSSLSQRIEWDGKDDFGFPVPAPETKSVRVQAGMSVKLKNIVGDDPYYFTYAQPQFGGSVAAGVGALAIAGMAQGADGSVFICGTPGPIFHHHEGWSYVKIRKYDRQGNYLKTLFPIPAGLDTSRVSGFGLRIRQDGSYVLENASTSMPTYSKTNLSGPGGGGSILGLDGNNELVFGSFVKSISLPQDGSLPGNRASANFIRSPALPGSYNRTGSTFFTLLPNKKEALVSGFFHYIGANGHVTSAPDTHFFRDGRVFKVDLATGAASALITLDSVPQPVAARVTALSGGEFFASIHGTAVDSKGRLYICDRLHRCIGVYDTLGTRLGAIPLTGADRVAIAPSGAIYAAVRTQAGTGSSTGTIRLLRFRPFDDGGAEVASLSVTTGIGGGTTNLVVNEGPSDTLVWLGYSTTTVRIYRAEGSALTLVKDFASMSINSMQGYARLAVDRRNETVYINNTWYGIYKITDWSNPRPVICTTNVNNVKKQLFGKDMAVSPFGMLYVLEGSLFDGPIKRFSTDHYHAPLNWTNTNSNQLTPYIGGRYGGTTGARGLAVATDNRVLSTWGATPFFTSWYADSGSAVRSGGDTLIKSSVVKTGCPRLDLKGNLYLAAATAAPGRTVPTGFAGDWAYGNGTATIVKFPANLDSGHITATGVFGASKVYDISIAPFSADRGAGGCVCRSPRFDVDYYGRIFAANVVTCEVTIADNEGNVIKKLGSYGNSDDRFNADSTNVPLLHPLSVAAGEEHLFIADYANCRLLRLKMNYALDNHPEVGGRLDAAKRPGDAGRVEMTSRPVPFNPSSAIQIRLSREERIRLDVFDVTGRHVITLASDRYPAGNHRFTWNGRDMRNSPVSAGTYYYRLTAGNRELYRKTVLVK